MRKDFLEENFMWVILTYQLKILSETNLKISDLDIITIDGKN